MKYPILLLLAACSAAVFLSGCASLIVRSEAGVDELYLGTKTDWAIVRGRGAGGDFSAYTSALWPFALIDLPFSMVLDTILLPVDVILAGSKEIEHEN